MDGECIGKDPAVGEADESSVSIVVFLGRFRTATSADGASAAATATAAAAGGGRGGGGDGGGFFNDDDGGSSLASVGI